MSFGVIGLIGLAFFIFIVFFVFKQIQFFFTAVDLYKGMNQRLDKVIELLSANSVPSLSLNAPVQHDATTSRRGESPPLPGLITDQAVQPVQNVAMGSCPNCKTRVPLNAEDCPKCGASFAPGAWKVLPS